jgi:hypothetical protein
VVDNRSTATEALSGSAIAYFPGVRVIALDRRLTVLESGHRLGVEAARGAFVAFVFFEPMIRRLSTDPGWSVCLLEVLESDDEIGSCCALR